ncbi:helix-turn-helix transcriptional regulator [Actinomadura sp. DC4]|uniref:helix-turn-helix domain-containing protein n=1 Tax=Actinomadura sp. DC4 TaxID=3055069 RepID=UPI0025B153AF|nr:helix-turn-helix transcriptional regulator [Actinomadura sp. DC4]MDN3357862.1 helix-turn-helix transcriptional regulator [Actinomadura sp. DC4]
MATDQGPVVQSALLRSDLTRLRKEKRLTQEMVARELEWSPSKLIRVEGGRSAITKTDLDALLTHYEVTSADQRERLHTLNRGAREAAWWSKYRGEISVPYLSFVGYEAGAAFVRQFQGAVIPGLLQTLEYAEVLTSGSVDPMRVAPVVKLRMERQVELAKRANPPRQYYVVDEAAIRRHVGIKKDPSVMPDQLRHVVDVVERDERVSFRVIPFSAGAHMGMLGSFTLLEFDGDLPDVLHLERRGESENLVTGEDPQIVECADAFESMLGEEALSDEESLEFVRSVAEEMS